MYFNQLKRKLTEQATGYEITSQISCYGSILEQADGFVLIDKQLSEFKTLEEARQYIIQQKNAEKLEEDISRESYEEINNITISSIIKEHHDIKITDTILESYISLASSKIFTLDPVVNEIRGLNKLDNIFPGKLDFILEDGSSVAINESTFTELNNKLGSHSDIIKYMRESKQNFINVIEQLEV